jgi:uncharacterized membrane protein YphA (DoxX/SURF4 family)
MDSDAKTARVLSILLALVYVVVAVAQIAGVAGVAESFARWGYPTWFRYLIGVLELAGAAILLIPKISGFACVLLGVLMVGAIYTHALAGEFPMILLNALLLALLGWLGWLRRPTFT